MQVWMDDRLVPEEQARVSVLDHGFLVGDGVFESVKVLDGAAFALTRHVRRLLASAAGLGLSAPDESRVRQAVASPLGHSTELRPLDLSERTTGFEPATLTLAR